MTKKIAKICLVTLLADKSSTSRTTRAPTTIRYWANISPGTTPRKHLDPKKEWAGLKFLFGDKKMPKDIRVSFERGLPYKLKDSDRTSTTASTQVAAAPAVKDLHDGDGEPDGRGGGGDGGDGWFLGTDVW